MFMMEEQAKEKACCKVMPQKDDRRLMTAACLASECMAWRWEVMGAPVNDNGGRADIRTRRGYCGLAGEPSRYDITQDEIDEIRKEQGDN
jgi:hypothetical protein